MNTQQAIQPARTLTSALDRLRSIDVRLAAANQQSQRFLDALVGPKSAAGQSNAAGEQIHSACFVSDLHRLIDSIESEALTASRRAAELLDAGACEETESSQQNQLSGLYSRAADAIAAQDRPRNYRELMASNGCV